MFSTYRRYRKEVIKLHHLRATGSAIDHLGKEVFSLAKTDANRQEEFRRLQTQADELIDSMLNDIPWIYKIVPVK